MKKITKKLAESILAKIDYEGFDYYMENWGPGDFKDTEFEPVLEKFLKARTELEGVIMILNEKFCITSY